MKILHVCLTGGYTEGSGYQENYLTKFQALAGMDVYIITTQYGLKENIWSVCTKSDYKNEYGVNVIRLPYKLKIPYRLNTYLGIFRGFYEQLNVIKPNKIFIHNIQFQDIRKIKKYAKENPYVDIYVDNHTDFLNSAKNWMSYNLLYKKWWKRCATLIEPYVKKFYGVLPARVDFLHDVYGVPENKIELLVMGADDESVIESKKEGVRTYIRNKYAVADNEVLLLTGGKIDSNKPEVITLLRAVKKLNLKKVKLIIFGAVMDSLKSEFNELINGDNIIFVGWKKSDEVYSLFEAADLVVFPGLHSVLWEQAAGMGKACIYRRIEGFDHINLGGNCVFFDDLTEEDILDKLTSVIDSQEWRKMQAIAEEKCIDYFSYRSIAMRSIEQ